MLCQSSSCICIGRQMVLNMPREANGVELTSAKQVLERNDMLIVKSVQFVIQEAFVESTTYISYNQ